jgi:hypothetical protein
LIWVTLLPTLLCISNDGTHFNIERVELPVVFASEAGHVDALGDVDGLRQLVDVFERALDAVKDGAQDTGAQLHGQRLARAQHWVAHSHTRSFLVYLPQTHHQLKFNKL